MSCISGHEVCGLKGRDFTICLAVSQVFALVHYTVQMGGMFEESFTEFLAGETHLDENATHYLIFDGAPAHRRPEQPRDNVNYLRILRRLTIPKCCRACDKLPEGQH